MVTIIMPAYNCEKYLEAAVESVKTQTYKNWKLLIIDDCSTDGTKALAHRLAETDDRIRVICNETNSGVSRTRNRGIQEAESEWIAFLDSDDTWEPEKLERQLSIADGIDIVYCSYDLIDENSQTIHRAFIVPKKATFWSMLTSSVISCSTAMIRTSVLKEHSFNPEIYHEDYMLWMELLKLNCKAVGDAKILAHYRQVTGSRNMKKGNAAKERWKIYRKYLHLNLLTSTYAFIGYVIKGVLKYYL